MRKKTEKKLERVNALVEKGMSTTAACEKVGLALKTYRVYQEVGVESSEKQPEPVSTESQNQSPFSLERQLRKIAYGLRHVLLDALDSSVDESVRTSTMMAYLESQRNLNALNEKHHGVQSQ